MSTGVHESFHLPPSPALNCVPLRHVPIQHDIDHHSRIATMNEATLSQTPVKQLQLLMSNNQYQQHAVPHEERQRLGSADYERTRAWVEKHNGLSIKNIPVPVIKEENETPSHCCSESRDALYVQMDRHALAKFNLNQAVSKNYTKNLYPAVDKNELMDDGLTKTGSYGSPRNGFNFQSLISDQSGESSANVTRTKLPPFSASFHKRPPLENKFNPLMPIPHGNCCEPMDTSLPKKIDNLSSSIVSASSNYHTMPLSKTEKKKLG